MIQDISPHKLDNYYSADIKPEPQDIVFRFEGNCVLAGKDISSPFPEYSMLTVPDIIIYLFSIGEKKYFLSLDSVLINPDGFSYQEIKKLRHTEGMSKENVFAMFTALHLHKWYSGNRLCGYCGGNMVSLRTQRALQCTRCKNIIYPRINPAVIVGITNGDELLITRYAQGHGVSYDALVAGFTEIGETFEETVEREVMEEVGLKVKNIRYYKSQPWGYSGGILAGFYCDVDGETEIKLDESELSSAVWTKREDIKGQPDDYSLTNEMMMNFKNNKD